MNGRLHGGLSNVHAQRGTMRVEWVPSFLGPAVRTAMRRAIGRGDR